MDKNKIKEKARDVAKFTYEVIDDIFGKRILDVRRSCCHNRSHLD